MYTDGMTDAQASAVMSDDARVVVVAGAGAGKTRVIERRIRRLIGTKVPASKMLAITFTNKAADEMRARLEAVGWRRREMPTIRTFHGFCVTVLRSNPGVIGRTHSFWIVDEIDRAELIRRAASETGAKHKTLRALEADRAVMQEYARILRRADAVDFDLIESGALEVMRQGGRWRSVYSDVIVDEFQDSSPAQVEILHRLQAERLFIVGDPRQAIYGFRGADPTFIRAAFSGAAIDPTCDQPRTWTPIYLADNFRSVEPVVRVANTICCDDEPMTSRREGGRVAHGVAEVVQVLAELRQRYAPGEIAVLARRWSDLETVNVAVRRAIGERSRNPNAPEVAPLFVYRPQDDVWTTLPARAFLALAQIVRSPHADHLVGRILQMWPSPDDPPIASLARTAARQRLMLSQCAAETNAVVRAVLSLRERQEGSHVLVDDLLRVLIDLAPEIGMLRAMVGDMRFMELDELIAWSVTRSHMDTTHAPPDHMHGMTIHAAKGLEFPAVVIVNVRDGVFPHDAANARDREEDRRVLYVGATRARDELHLIRDADVTSMWSPAPNPTRSTPFLPEE